MQTVTSRDGTRIAFWRSGGGPPLLLVHGTVADHTTTWRLVLPELERRFTVYAMDRRGRGGSGDHPVNSLEREAEDVAADVDAIGDPVNVLGHSYGGLCAIEAAVLTANMRRLLVYEGVTLRGTAVVEPGVVDRLESMLEAGDVDGMLLSFLREMAGASLEEIDRMRLQRDARAVRLANAPTVSRELRAFEAYIFAPKRFGGVRTQTLLLVGGESPSHEWENARGWPTCCPTHGWSSCRGSSLSPCTRHPMSSCERSCGSWKNDAAGVSVAVAAADIRRLTMT